MTNKPFPDFIIPGAMKAGTTTLARYLEQHKNICFSLPKEPGVFLNKGYEGRNPDFRGPGFASAQEAFENCFREARTGQLLGEGTVAYFSAPESPDLFCSANPDIKAIFLLRDPAKRTQSAFHYSRSIFEEKAATMDIAFEEELGGKRENYWPTLRHLDYSSYSGHLDRWKSNLKPGNMLLLEFEEFVREPLAGLTNICTFLEVAPPEELPEGEKTNVTVVLDSPIKRNAMRLLYTKNPVKSILKPLLPARFRQNMKTKMQDALVSGSQETPHISPFCEQVMTETFSGMKEELAERFNFKPQQWTSG